MGVAAFRIATDTGVPSGVEATILSRPPRANLDLAPNQQEPIFSHLVGRFTNPIPYAAVLFRADRVARGSQIASDMFAARASSARKIPRRLRERICETTHLGSAPSVSPGKVFLSDFTHVAHSCVSA